MIQIEFAVELPNASSRSKLKESLTKINGIESVQVYPNFDTVVIKSLLPISVLLEKVESAAGQRAVIKGYGGTDEGIADWN